MSSVSIVIPTYFRVDKLAKCLESIVKFTDPKDVTVVVVANGAPEDTKIVFEQFQREWQGRARLLWFDEALGYPKACNQGIRATDSNYVVLFNDDCELLPQPQGKWIGTLLYPFLTQERVGITGPQRLFDENSGHNFLIFFCVMLSRDCLNDIGLLDESTGIGFGEDTIACIEAERKGWKVLQVPDNDHVNTLAEIPPDSTIEGWKHDRIWAGDFGLWHDAESTLGNMPESQQALDTNRAMLRERYGDKVNTPTNQCERCGGPTVDGVCVGAENKLNCDGLYLWRASVVDGWFGCDEGAWLAAQVKALPAGSKVLSVGAWHGRSSRFIADNLSEDSQLWDIDTWNGSSGEPDAHLSAAQREGDHAYSWYYCNLHSHIVAGRVVPMRIHSANGAETLSHLIEKGEMERFSLVFIDGDHSAEGIKTDVEAWLPLLKEGGLLCGHDYYKENEGPWWVHVRQFVEEKFPNVEKSATSIWHVRPHGSQERGAKGRLGRCWYEDEYTHLHCWELTGHAGPHKCFVRYSSAFEPQVYDCIPFNDELLLLETRLAELNEVVDRFVIAEAPLSHSGQPKPLYFEESIQREPERWGKYLPKIIHLVIDDFQLDGLEGSDLHWAIERHQRDSLMNGLKGCQDNDIVIISDTDEIPRAEAIKSYDPSQGLCALEMKLYYGSMNCQEVAPWREGRILPYGLLKTQTPCAARYALHNDLRKIENAGWHFSFMGGPKAWVKKLENTAHQEYNKPEFKDKQVMLERVRSGKDLLGREIPYHLIDVDDSFPRFVRDNIQKFKDEQFIMEAQVHPEAYSYVAQIKSRFPEYFKNKKVLEVGSLIINGTVRDFFEDCDYTGIDLAEGAGVDEVRHVCEIAIHNTFDVVICTEALEHDEKWNKSLFAMYYALKPNGLLLVTCAGPTRPEHGTTRTDTYSSPFTTDYYKNISREDFLGVLGIDLFSDCEIGYQRGMEDLCFYGIKKDEKPAPSNTLAKKKWTVTAEISTLGRYHTTLPLTIASVATQTHKPDKLKIYDDGEQLDLREISPFNNLLKIMLEELKIEWEILKTPRVGQVGNHQHCLDNATTHFIWRIDDDELAMPNCLEVLLNTIRDYGIGGDFENIGAVGGLVHHPGAVGPPPDFLDGSLADVDAGLNLAWYHWNGGPREVQHLYSTFLFRVDIARKVGGYPKTLSTVGHREETILTASIARAGYKVLLTPSTVTFHLRESSGGIRSFTDQSLWEHDEQIWQSYRKEWGMNGSKPTKLINLDFGIGDTFAFKSILPELRKRHADKELVLAVCFPEVLKDEGLKMISIADCKTILGERYDESLLYRHLWSVDWKGPLTEGMLEFWG